MINLFYIIFILYYSMEIGINIYRWKVNKQNTNTKDQDHVVEVNIVQVELR